MIRKYSYDKFYMNYMECKVKQEKITKQEFRRFIWTIWNVKQKIKGRGKNIKLVLYELYGM